MFLRNINIILLLLVPFIASAQNYELFGLIDNKIYKIDKVTGQLSLFVEVEPRNSNNLRGLSFHEGANCFFSIKNPDNTPMLVKISIDGIYSEVGYFKYNSIQIKLCESLAYDSKNNKLIVAASLNGGTQDGDFYSESILEVNINNGSCSLSYVLSMENSPDGDQILMDQGILYAFDAQPPSMNYFKIYKYPENSGSNPSKLFESNYYASIDGTILERKIYFLENRNLWAFDLSSNSMLIIGQTHSFIDFNGKLFNGMTKKHDCELSKISLPKDVLLCDQNLYIMNVYTNNAEYLWSTGSTSHEITVSESGKYWITVTNSCGSITDTIKVQFLSSPEINLGTDRTLCDDEILHIDLPNKNLGYLWENGSLLSYRTITSPGTYSVTASNACGSTQDHIHIRHLAVPTISMQSDTVICSGSFYVDIMDSESNYYWQNSSGDTVMIIDTSDKYKLTVKNVCGKAESEMNIRFLHYDHVFIPNVFTPNFDLFNQYFEVDERLIGSRLKVFNRWGTLVYETFDYQNDWDGSELSTGVYYYIVYDACENEHKGVVSIIR